MGYHEMIRKIMFGKNVVEHIKKRMKCKIFRKSTFAAENTANHESVLKKSC